GFDRDFVTAGRQIGRDVIARLVGFESARDPGFNIGDSDLCATHYGAVQIADAAQNASLIGLRGDGAAEDHREQRNHQQITARKKLTPTRFFHILISSDREMCPITSLCLCERGLRDAEMRAFVMSKSLAGQSIPAILAPRKQLKCSPPCTFFFFFFSLLSFHLL